MFGNAYGPALFRHHNDQRVAHLRKPHARGVTRARFTAFFNMLRERQIHGEPIDPFAFNDHGAVVRWRLRVKEPIEQRIADPPVKRNPAPNMPLQGFAPFKNEQRPDFIFSQFLHRLDDHVGGLRRGHGPLLRPERTPGRKTLDGPADVGLEHDDQRDQNRGKADPEKPRGQKHVEALRADIERGNKPDSHHKRARGPLSQPYQAKIQQYRNNDNVKNIGNAHGRRTFLSW